MKKLLTTLLFWAALAAITVFYIVPLIEGLMVMK